MKQAALYFLSAIIFFASACTDSKTESTLDLKIKKDSLLLFKLPVDNEKILGFYEGDFGEAPISFALRFISGKNISGYNIYKGNKRNIKGTIVFENNQLHLIMSEPGTENQDGKFDFYLDTTKLSGGGTWLPIVNTSLGKKTFTLTQSKDNTFENDYAEFVDSLNHSIVLKSGKLCEYAYYTNEKTDAEQKNIVKGSYKILSNKMAIYWQQNNVFTEPTSTLKISKEFLADYGDSIKVLTGKIGRFTQIVMP